MAEGEVMEAAGQSASRPPRRSSAASWPRLQVLEVKLQQAEAGGGGGHLGGGLLAPEHLVQSCNGNMDYLPDQQKPDHESYEITFDLMALS